MPPRKVSAKWANSSPDLHQFLFKANWRARLGNIHQGLLLKKKGGSTEDNFFFFESEHKEL